MVHKRTHSQSILLMYPQNTNVSNLYLKASAGPVPQPTNNYIIYNKSNNK